jgi:hypothetical protein
MNAMERRIGLIIFLVPFLFAEISSENRKSSISPASALITGESAMEGYID